MTSRKLMVLGEIGVGKTSLVRRLVLDRFSVDYTPTIGADVYTYHVPESAECPAMKLLVWDTDGNFGDAIFSHVYMRDAAAALIVGDVTRLATLEAMADLGSGFRNSRPGRYLAYAINKCDLLDGPPPHLGDARLPARLTAPDTELLPTSAKSGSNVREAFHDAAIAIHRRGL